MGKPLIGISGRRWPTSAVGDRLPRAMRDLSFDLHLSDYPKSVAAAGGVPVELTRDANVMELMEHLDGLVLSGGADVDPARYGGLPEELLGETEPDRDAWELELVRVARERHVPILAICRGFQLLNVALGGTLHQHVDVSEGSGHPQWDVDGRTTTHDVHVVAETLTATLLPPTWPVNSLHHQTVDRLASGLVASAFAPDGVLEGYETPEGDVLAVQWHPELLRAPDPTFLWLVRSATSARATRSA